MHQGKALALGKELSDRRYCNRISVDRAEEQTLEDRRNSENCERFSAVDEDRDQTQNYDRTFQDPSNRKLSITEVAGNRLYKQAKEREQRKEMLRRQHTLKTKRRISQVTIESSEAKKSRITALYELGKNRVTVNRKLAATKLHSDRVTVRKGPTKPSKRISALYEIGKSRVNTSRKLAARKLVESNNRAVKVKASSNAKRSPSEIAGGRLYVQAQLRAERKEKRKEKVRATQPPKMELATKQRSNDKPVDWGKSPPERFFALYEQGKDRVTADRVLEIMGSGNKADSANEEIIPGYANIRQMELYELGKQKLLNERMSEKQHSDTIHDDNISSQLLTTIVANTTMIKLYEMSKEMQENGKGRREDIICAKDKNSIANLHAHRTSKEIVPNATMVKLYAMSQLMQEHGKERREEIYDARGNFPVLKI